MSEASSLAGDSADPAQPDGSPTDVVNPDPAVEVSDPPLFGGGPVMQSVAIGVADTETMPASAADVFGDQTSLAQRFAELLVTDGVVRGALGPREPTRIWSRHLLNCAVVADLFPVGARVVDVGSGAGLPGIALAIRRPDLLVELVEPMQRRVDFLEEMVDVLGVSARVRIVRGRADDAVVIAAVGQAGWVTARAVAPLDRLVRWCVPLLMTDGRLALIKGASATEELNRHRAMLSRLGMGDAQVVECGGGLLDLATQVITMKMSRERSKRRGKR